MVNALGDDVFGDMTMRNFAELGIDARFVTRVTGSSGVAPIWVEPDGTNRIICVAGANDAMIPADAAAAVRALAPLDVVVGEFEIPQPVTTAAFAAARTLGAITVLNPAPAADMDPALLAVTDWLIPNEHEFARIAGATPDVTDAEIVRFAGVCRHAGRRDARRPRRGAARDGWGSPSDPGAECDRRRHDRGRRCLRRRVRVRSGDRSRRCRRGDPRCPLCLGQRPAPRHAAIVPGPRTSPRLAAARLTGLGTTASTGGCLAGRWTLTGTGAGAAFAALASIAGRAIRMPPWRHGRN